MSQTKRRSKFVDEILLPQMTAHATINFLYESKRTCVRGWHRNGHI